MTSEAQNAIKQISIQDLERRLAEREARCSIESYCLRAGIGKDNSGWYNIAKHDPDAGAELEEAVRYLELRGLLERRKGEPNIVRVRETE